MKSGPFLAQRRWDIPVPCPPSSKLSDLLPKQILTALCLGALTISSALAEPKPEGSGVNAPIRIVSWNIAWFPGKSIRPNPEGENAQIEVVLPELKKLNPDILLAQEIRDWRSFALLTDAVPGLRPLTVSSFANEETGEYWPQQVAIAAKLPALAAWSEPWKAGSTITPRRGFTAALLELPGTKKGLLVYSLHLKSNRSSSPEEEQLNFDTRNESIHQLLAHITHMEQVLFKDRIAGVVVGGDFNTNHDGQFGDKVIALMTEAGFTNTWDDLPAEARQTWRGTQKFKPTTFDYIFTRGLPKLRVQMLDAPVETSDHLPLLLEWTPTP